MLAGIIQSPTAYDPAAHPVAAQARGATSCCARCSSRATSRQRVRAERRPGAARRQGRARADRAAIEGSTRATSRAGCSSRSSNATAPRRAFDGGLRIKTTLDIDLQHAAEHAVDAYLESPEGPTASLVAIENSTGEVRAMVGGARLLDDPVQPRHQGPAPARLLVQGLRPRRRAAGRDLARLGLDLQAEGIHRPRHRRQGKVRGPQRREQLLRLEHPDRRHRLLRQLDLRRSRDQGRHEEDRAPGPADGHPTPLSTNPAMTIGGLTRG